MKKEETRAEVSFTIEVYIYLGRAETVSSLRYQACSSAPRKIRESRVLVQISQIADESWKAVWYASTMSLRVKRRCIMEHSYFTFANGEIWSIVFSERR